MSVQLDASALVALLLDEPAAGQVAALLEERPTAIAAINLGEAIDVVARRSGAEAASVERSIAKLTRRGLTLGTDSPELAGRAAAIRSRRYHGRHRPVSLADCVAVAAARGATLATADRDQATVAREEGVEVIDLPPSTLDSLPRRA